MSDESPSLCAQESAFALELASWAGEDGESEEAMLERQRAAARAVLGSARSAAR